MNRRILPLLAAILAIYTPCLAAQPGPQAAVLSAIGELLTAHGPALVAIVLVFAAGVFLSHRLSRR